MRMMSAQFPIAILSLACLLVTSAHSHDTWVQTQNLVTRYQDVVHVDLMLGNHGNNHRDFKLASKITLAPCTLEVIAPDGKHTDLKPRISDMGSAEKEGFWTAKMIAEQKGVYQVVHTLDTLHGRTRAIKSGKTFFIASTCFGSIPTTGKEKILPLNKGLELVLDSAIEKVSAGNELKLRVLWNSKPLSNTTVSFIPRGTKLAEGRDENFDRTSDAEGYVSFVPSDGNLLLAVVHHLASDETGENYDQTHYSATMVLPVPQIPYVK